MPVIFVFLWSTGFIGAKYGLPYAEPCTFLLYRLVIVIILLTAAALFARAKWPKGRKEIFHCIVSGVLLHGVYLGGVFTSISLGLPAGISALIVGTQPLLTAVLSRSMLGEKISGRQWFTLAMGFCGVGLVLVPRLSSMEVANITLANISFSFAALFGITLGTIYQKSFVTALDIRTSGVFQYLGAAVLVALGAVLFETMEISWTWQFIGALAWLIIVLSIGAISLLVLIIRHGRISRIATMFYMVPPVTAIIAFVLFDERLSMIQIIGMVVTAISVWLNSLK
jgi:drug/metabolite transporter (DMT)-like permease